MSILTPIENLENWELVENSIPRSKDYKHPIQPIVYDENGIQRFKENKILKYLIESGDLDLNKVAELAHSFNAINDREQINQLMGYSIGGFLDTNPSTETATIVEEMADKGITEDQARNNYLRNSLKEYRLGMVNAVSALFEIDKEELLEKAEVLNLEDTQT